MRCNEPITLEGIKLRAQRGDREIFKDISFTLRKRQALWIKGPNGSGKTTFLRGLAGVFPLEGTLLFKGAPLHSNRASYQSNFCFISAHPPLNPNASVIEHLLWWHQLQGHVADNLDQTLESMNLTKVKHNLTKTLSFGEKQQLSLCRLKINSSPESFWLLDEPALGLDKANRQTIKGLIDNHLARGGMLCYADHEGEDLPYTHTLDFKAIP